MLKIKLGKCKGFTTSFTLFRNGIGGSGREGLPDFLVKTQSIVLWDSVTPRGGSSSSELRGRDTYACALRHLLLFARARI